MLVKLPAFTEIEDGCLKGVVSFGDTDGFGWVLGGEGTAGGGGVEAGDVLEEVDVGGAVGVNGVDDEVHVAVEVKVGEAEDGVDVEGWLALDLGPGEDVEDERDDLAGGFQGWDRIGG